MKAEMKEINGIKIARMAGQVRIPTQHDFRDILDELAKDCEGGTVIINMDGVVHMDSAGLSIITEADRRFKEKKGRLILCNLLPDIMKLFEVTKLNKFIEIYPSEREALNRL